MDKWGLAFAGGGGKGAYQIGSWKAIKEYGINIEAVSGTSSGALNAALVAMGAIELAENIWRNQVDRQTVFTPKKKELPMIKRGMIKKSIAKGQVSRSGLEAIIQTNNICQAVLESDIPCYASCVNISRMKEEYKLLNDKTPDEINNILLASSAIPVVFPVQVLENGEQYLDGAIPIIGDNAPVKPLIDEGCNKILVINLSSRIMVRGKEIIEAYVPGKEVSINYEYEGVQIYNQYPKDFLGGIITGLFNFDQEKLNLEIDMGYQDTMSFLKENVD